jgi:aldose 1-epimerase
LNIEYRAVSDKKTIFNPTNHAYFDLSGGKTEPLDHELKVFGNSYLEANDEFLPTGNILLTAGAAFDFNEYQRIRELMPLKKEVIKGYNTYFIGDETKNGEMRMLASLMEKNSGRILEVSSDFPGIMFYTGDYLSGQHKPFGGLCLEAQLYPDAPNHKHFLSCIVNAGQEIIYRLRYKFLTI